MQQCSPVYYKACGQNATLKKMEAELSVLQQKQSLKNNGRSLWLGYGARMG